MFKNLLNNRLAILFIIPFFLGLLSVLSFQPFNLTLVNQKIAKERLYIFQHVAEKIKSEYRQKLVNKKSIVLFENKIQNENKFFGRDEYFNSVIVKSEKNLIGTIQSVKILKVNRNTLFGELISNFNQKNCAA